jgi:hypothetical protein
VRVKVSYKRKRILDSKKRKSRLSLKKRIPSQCEVLVSHFPNQIWNARDNDSICKVRGLFFEILVSDLAFAAHCLQSAARKCLISRPIQRATRVVRCPCLLNVVRLSVAAQVLSDIHWLAGRSLTGGGITSRRNSLYLATSSVRGPQGIWRGK